MSNLISRQKAIDELIRTDAIPRGFVYHVIDTIRELPSVQPESHYDEWCTDCKEYDQTKHCCPRFNKVIKNTLKDTQSTAHKTAHWTNIKISFTESEAECSLCGAIVHSSFSDRINYCPNCGAYMGGEQDD